MRLKAINNKHYAQANYLALFTIFYNLVEGGASVWLGTADETLALFGFGVDSFIEVISAMGVWHMLRRIAANSGESRDEFEQRALKITGSAFYLLSLGLLVTAAMNLYSAHKPSLALRQKNYTSRWLHVRELIPCQKLFYQAGARP